MRSRRDLLLLASASAFTVAVPAFAQQPAKVRHVGFLAQGRRPNSFDSGTYGAFRQGMRELGHVEGKNLAIEWRFADGDYGRLPHLAAELVKLKVDVIVTGGAPAISAVQKATDNIPVVMGSVGDPVGAGFVKSLARPGGNITGLSNISVSVSPKLLEMLLAMAPRLTRVAVLLNPVNSSNVMMLSNIQAAAPAGASILPTEARTVQEIEAAFPAMVRQKAEAVIVISDTLLVQNVQRIAQLTAKHRLPSISASLLYAEAGGLLSYGPDLIDRWRRAAIYVDRIFKGAKPGDLPVEQPTKFELVINRKTARALGLTIPQSLLISADRVID